MVFRLGKHTFGGSTSDGTDGGNNDGDSIAATNAATNNGAAADGTITWTDPIGSENRDSDGGEPVKRRGRPRGSRNKQTAKGDLIGEQGVAGILVSLHSVLSIVARSPELALDEDEAKAIARASLNVASLYDMKANEKALAWTNLIGVVIAIEGPKAFAVYTRLTLDKKQTKAPNVVSMNPSGAGPPFAGMGPIQ